MKRLFRQVPVIALVLALLAASPAAAAKGVILNFTDVDIATMVKFISDLTGRNFILDERVKGKISVFSPAKLSNDEAYNVFVSVLELKGFTVVQSGRVAKIVPAASAKQSALARYGAGPVNEAYVAHVAKLGYVTAQEAVAFLQPMVSKDGHISAFAPGNLVLLVDSALNVRRLQGLIETIDTSRAQEGVAVIYLKNAAADQTAAAVRQWLAGDAKGQLPPGVASVMADKRLNALLVFGDAAARQAVAAMVRQLDVPPPEASSKINVYYLENTDAVEMAKVLDGVVKGAAPATGASPFDGERVAITPDKVANALVVTSSPNDFASLAQVIRKLDRRSRQVFVEVLIAEVSLDKGSELGVQAGVLGADVLSNYLAVAGIYDPLGTFGQLLGNLGGTSSTAALLRGFEPRAVSVATVLKALDRDGMVNILSTPKILTSDNKEAEINVGENVPFQGASTMGTFGTTTSVERKDVGINLKIKPQIGEGDYVRMEISQEISAVKNDKGQAVDLVTTRRSAKTNVVVRNNQTVVIGGLIQDTEDLAVQKTPLLGDIPLLGWLFKTSSRVRRKTNLMLMITPRVVREDADLAAVTTGERHLFGRLEDGRLDAAGVLK